MLKVGLLLWNFSSPLSVFQRQKSDWKVQQKSTLKRNCQKSHTSTKFFTQKEVVFKRISIGKLCRTFNVVATNLQVCHKRGNLRMMTSIKNKMENWAQISIEGRPACKKRMHKNKPSKNPRTRMFLLILRRNLSLWGCNGHKYHVFSSHAAAAAKFFWAPPMKKPLWKAAFPALLSSLATFEIPEFSVKKAGILKGRGSFQYQFPMPFEVLLRPEPAWAATYVQLQLLTKKKTV